MNPGFHRLALVASIVALCVVALGAYVRLSHAGLGCPDWPGCYGRLTWPDATHEVHAANEAFPERPVEVHKAWKEMFHRYLAGFLVLLVLLINYRAWKLAGRGASHRFHSGLLLGLILFQAALGMWTVTLQLMPLVVLAHLMGGMATFALLVWLAARTGLPARYEPSRAVKSVRNWILIGLLVLIVQISLGGWTSANYAALACLGFPGCGPEFWPASGFDSGFTLLREIGVNYEGGVLDLAARQAIHMTHRLGGVVTFVVLAVLAVRLMRGPITRRSGALLLFLVLLQVTLGVLNIELVLPLPNAVAHNAVAAVLLAQMTWLLHRSTPHTG